MSGWTVMTVEPPKDAGDTVIETIESCPHCGEPLEQREVTPEERIERYLQDEHGEDADGYADRTVQLPRGMSDDLAIKVANAAFDECAAAGRVAIVTANDTSDSGSYWYLERNETGGATLVDQWDGYEGARGNDAVGRLQEQHDMRGYCSWEA